ncbi:MAG: IS200/IS605 family transposase [Candidatus Uhrbacteria bacterium]
MSRYIHKSHNVSVILYHIVCPAKYRKVIFNEKIDDVLKSTCLEIARRYEIEFLEIGTDKDHVHFLIQSVPTYSPTRIVKMLKSITAKEVFRLVPDIKRQLWGGQLWSDGYFINTVGQHANESVIMQYIRNQGKEQEYKRLHQQKLTL